MDFAALRHSLDAYDYHLFAVGQTEVTVSALVKLAISAAVLYFIAGRFSRWTLNRLLAHTKMPAGQKPATVGLVHYAVLVIGGMLILQNAGIQLTAFTIVASALGVGVGFGLQNIISNFISGLIVLLERPIEVGDRIEINGVEGVVTEVGARRTTVVTPDRIAILVPNQSFITSNVTNYVYLQRTVRLRVPIVLAPGQDVRQVERLLLDATKTLDVEADPAPQVAIVNMTATALGMELWVWYDGQRFAKADVLSQVYFAVVDVLGTNGIRMGA